MTDLVLGRLVCAMTDYYAGDAKRIQHFIKVRGFAATIGRLEGLDKEVLFVLETAALVHDIGIKVCERKYGSCNGKLQELEGPAEAEKLLVFLGDFSTETIERVCWLVAHHHTYNDIADIDYQILVEADFLVNVFEDGILPDAISQFKKNVFKTKTGIYLLERMYANSD